MHRLAEANALDFDDIILHAVTLLQQEGEVRDYYRRKFRYVLIDEYQDTNRLQYLLMKQLVGEKGNICVVGDDDQSIYKFRGADITKGVQGLPHDPLGAELPLDAEHPRRGECGH